MMKTVQTQLLSLTSGDFFSGAGGLAAGFHAAGFSPNFFNELDPQASTTFRTNFSKATPFVCPIQELTVKKIQDECEMPSDGLDVILGGPPCQGFSINAPARSEEDPRNSLFRHYIRLVLEGLRPKFVVMENVPGLISFDDGKTLQSVKTAFEQAGYKTAFRILNAAHYGVPQERWRLIFIGTRLEGIEPSFPTPTHFSLQRANFTGGREHTFSFAIGKPESSGLFEEQPLLPPTTVGAAMGDLPPIESGEKYQETGYPCAPQNEYQTELRRDSELVLNHECSDMAAVNFERLSFVKPGGSWRDIPHNLLPKGLQRAKRSDHTKRYGRLDSNGLSATILTKCDPHWGTFFHYSQDRIISVREAARLQSFPDWFRFTGSRGEQYRQVGNAVPPLLARAIATHIKALIVLQGSQENSTPQNQRESSQKGTHATSTR